MALRHVRDFITAGTQYQLNLAGIGESTLHPCFCEYVELAREACGPMFPIIIATNGVGMTREIMASLRRAAVAVYVSLHRPEKASLAVSLAKEYGVFNGASADPSLNPNNWAGQVDWINEPDPDVTIPCHWLRDGRVMVCADGAITTCCLDAHGTGIVGHVDQTAWETKPYDLCPHCYQEINIDGHTQRETA
jgi:hypothetical protein